MIEVTVVDATLGRSTDHGRVVADLTLDIRVRSTTDIQLVEAKPGTTITGSTCIRQMPSVSSPIKVWDFPRTYPLASRGPTT